MLNKPIRFFACVLVFVGWLGRALRAPSMHSCPARDAHAAVHLPIKCISPPGCRRRGCNLPVKGAPTRPVRVFVLCVLMQPWVCDAPLKTFARVPVLQSAVLFCPAAAASGLRVIGQPGGISDPPTSDYEGKFISFLRADPLIMRAGLEQLRGAELLTP